MSTYFRPKRPIEATELGSVPGIVVEDGQEGYSHQITDSEQSGYVHAVSNEKGQVIEFRRFGGNSDFADHALTLIGKALGVEFVDSYSDDFKDFDHRTPDEIAKVRPRRMKRVL